MKNLDFFNIGVGIVIMYVSDKPEDPLKLDVVVVVKVIFYFYNFTYTLNFIRKTYKEKCIQLINTYIYIFFKFHKR